MNRWIIAIICSCALGGAAIAGETAPGSTRSQGIYRLPFADATTIKVFDDFTTHRPLGRVDLFAVEGQKPYRVVAAAAGRVMAIQDSYGEQQSGRAAADCHNNYVWIAHPNAEWTNYSHLAQGSVSKLAKLKVGDAVKAGAFIGNEGAVGCAMLDHVHFEVAVPDAKAPIDSGGFLLDNEGGKRERNPQFCHVAGGLVVKDATYRAAACEGSMPSASTTAPLPAWAYPWDPNFKVLPDDGVPRRVPDSAAAFTLTQVRDLFFAPDWHPEEHPPMPEVVARGRKPDVLACGVCHRADGSGGPENARLAGLPREYIVQQIADYRSGARRSSVPHRRPVLLMNAIAGAANDAEIQTAADYFSSLQPRMTIKVIETDTVVKSYVAVTHFVAAAAGGTEPIGMRIVEVPVDEARFELRDTRSQFIAYVPVGSLARGEVLARTGGAGTTVACASCHGPELKGAGSIPGIAGRSPSYIVRQLYDFKQATRSGVGSALMKPTVDKLSTQDMISLAAYLASLKP